MSENKEIHAQIWMVLSGMMAFSCLFATLNLYILLDDETAEVFILFAGITGILWLGCVLVDIIVTVIQIFIEKAKCRKTPIEEEMKSIHERIVKGGNYILLQYGFSTSMYRHRKAIAKRLRKEGFYVWLEENYTHVSIHVTK